MVRSRGLEPPRCYSLPPQGSASTNSATSASKGAGPIRPAGNEQGPEASPLGLRGVEFVHVGGVGDGDAEPVALDGDFAPGDGVITGQDPELVGFLGVERNDRAAAHAQ